MPRILFFLIALTLFVLSHIYIIRRLFWASEAFPLWLKRVGSVLVGGAGALSIAIILLPRMKFTFLDAAAIQWVGYLWLGSFVFLLLLTFARDLLFFFGERLARWRVRREVNAASSPTESEGGFVGDAPISRRNLLFSMSSGAVLASAGAASTIGYQEARRLARVKTQEVAVEGLPASLDGFTIVQISDLHVGPTIKRDFLQAVVDRVNELSPDLIAITGDLVDGLPEKMRDEISPLADLEARHGAFYVTGNHEYYWDAPGWIEEVRRLGVTPLVNEHRVLQLASDLPPFVVAGVTDYSAGRSMPGHTSDAKKAFAGAPVDAVFKLLLAHQPKSIYDAARAQATLQLSGHTHGGQFYPWNLVVGLAHPFSVGLGLYEKTQIYVSRGTGYWGPPLRLGAPSEISKIILRRA